MPEKRYNFHFTGDFLPHPNPDVHCRFPSLCEIREIDAIDKPPIIFEFLNAGSFNAVYQGKEIPYKDTILKIPYDFSVTLQNFAFADFSDDDLSSLKELKLPDQLSEQIRDAIKKYTIKDLKNRQFNRIEIIILKKILFKEKKKEIAEKLRISETIFPCYCDSKNTENPERAVRIWNEVNGELGEESAKVWRNENDKAIAWSAPFIEGEEPTDEERADFVLRLYHKHGRILADAITRGNVIKFSKKQGEEKKSFLVCRDFGFCLRLIEEGDTQSEVSLHAWGDCDDLRGNDNYRTTYLNFYTENQKRSPLACSALRALLFLDLHRPFFREDQANFDEFQLTISPWVSEFSEAYQQNKNVIQFFNDDRVKEFNSSFQLPESTYYFVRNVTGLNLSDEQVVFLCNANIASRSHLEVIKILNALLYFDFSKCMKSVVGLSYLKLQYFLFFAFISENFIFYDNRCIDTIKNRILEIWEKRTQDDKKKLLISYKNNFFEKDYLRKVILILKNDIDFYEKKFEITLPEKYKDAIKNANCLEIIKESIESIFGNESRSALFILAQNLNNKLEQLEWVKNIGSEITFQP